MLFFCYPENVLLAMISDDRRHIRELGVKRILKARENTKSTVVRKFKIQTLNFEAKDYTDLIFWERCDVTSPPILKSVSDIQLTGFIELDNSYNDFHLYPSQAVERYIKLMSEASIFVIGFEARDGFVRATTKSRESLPNFENKKQYLVIN